MSHPRKYAIALIGADCSLTHLYAVRLSLAEALAWLDAHRRAPSPDGQPCLLLHPLLRAIRSAGGKGPRTRRKRE
jgi:hypothetical protein